MAGLINKKIDDGAIDVTNESSGVRSGTGVSTTSNGKNPLSL